MSKKEKFPFVYAISKPILTPLYRNFYHPHITGIENIPETGGASHLTSLTERGVSDRLQGSKVPLGEEIPLDRVPGRMQGMDLEGRMRLLGKVVRRHRWGGISVRSADALMCRIRS